MRYEYLRADRDYRLFIYGLRTTLAGIALFFAGGLIGFLPISKAFAVAPIAIGLLGALIGAALSAIGWISLLPNLKVNSTASLAGMILKDLFRPLGHQDADGREPSA